MDPHPCDASLIPEGMERCFPFFLDTSPYPSKLYNGSELHNIDIHSPSLQSSAWSNKIEEAHALMIHESLNINDKNSTSAETGLIDLFSVLGINSSHLFDPKSAIELHDHRSRSSSTQVST